MVRHLLVCASALVLSASTAHAGFQWTAPMGGVPAATSPRGNEVIIPRNGGPRELAPRAAAAPIAPVMTENLPNSMGNIQAGNPVRTMPDGPVSAAPIFGNGMTNDPITWNQGNNANAPRAPQNIVPAETVSLYPQPAGMATGVVPVPPMGAPQPIISQQQTMMQPVSATVTTTTMMPAPTGYGMYEVADGFGRDLPLVMAIRQIVPAQYGFVFDQGIDTNSKVSWQGGQPWDIVLQNTLAPSGLTAKINGNVVTVTRSSMQVASAAGVLPGMGNIGPIGGPVVMTDVVQTTTVKEMSATPVAMTNGVVDMGGMGNGYVNAAAPSTADLLSNSTWSAPRNSSLRNILEQWSERVGVELYWASEYDYPIQSAVSLQGTFEEAVQTLLKGLSESKPRPMARLHPNAPNGPAVLVIETRQNSM